MSDANLHDCAGRGFREIDCFRQYQRETLLDASEKKTLPITSVADSSFKLSR